MATGIIAAIEEASLYRRTLHIQNPVCEADVFTDRWPESLAQQDEFAAHLKDLVRSIEAMRRGQLLPDAMMDDLRESFGDRVVTRAADQIAADVGLSIQQSRQRYTRRGGLIVPAAGIAPGVASPAIATARPHTFYGRKI